MSDTILKPLKTKCRMLGALLLVGLMSNMSISPTVAGEPKGQKDVGCDIHQNPCTQSLEGSTITLDINPKPVKAMEDLTFTVTLSGTDPSGDPHIDLGMPGMDMGPNRVLLKRMGHGQYEGKGVIVRCPSGRRTWQATVTVPGIGAAEFIFDVIY